MARSKSVGSTPQSPAASESTRCDDDVAECEGHEHFEMNIVEEEFALNIDAMFNQLFTDSPLFAEFIRRRRTSDVKLSPWPEEADENGRRTRTICYTLYVNYGFGLKSCPSVETQVLHGESRVGRSYVVDIECVMSAGVPCCERFSTVVRYCMKRVAADVTRLSVTGKVRFHKPVWTFMKSLIQKTAASGLSDSFGVMVKLLHEAAAAAAGQSQRASRPCSLPVSRRSRTRITSPPSSSSRSQRSTQCRTGRIFTTSTDSDLPVFCQPSTPFSVYSTYGKREHELVRSSLDSNADPAQLLVVLLFIVVLALVVINALLYYQLTALETTVATKLVFDSVTVT